ncbi:hypothetical protein [Streptomyces aurantiacus]|uniref:hypothetical protein n=1 Tax=Streptomyces aurantiacus TaxID=47760 RepID=UPI000AAC71E4|nr:hypothetical protein [Streptomyces aurantiacus]
MAVVFGAGAGAGIGILGGMIGLGGAEFRLPLLISLFGFAVLSAVILNKAMSLVVVGIALPARPAAVSASRPAGHWPVAVNLLAGSTATEPSLTAPRRRMPAKSCSAAPTKSTGQAKRQEACILDVSGTAGIRLIEVLRCRRLTVVGRVGWTIRTQRSRERYFSGQPDGCQPLRGSGGMVQGGSGGSEGRPGLEPNRRLLETSGLARAAHATSCGEGGLDPDDVAKEFAALVTGPALRGEDWLLVDADLPEGCLAQVGEWTLERVSPQRLAELRPEGVLGRFRTFALDSDLLDGAAFLHRETAWRPTGTVLPWPVLHAHPQVHFAVPQGVLGLWACEPAHLDAIYYRENGRQTVREFGSVPVEEQSNDGVNFWERRVDGPYRVEPAELAAFTIFMAASGELMATAAAELAAAQKPADRKPSPRAQRLARATEHLVQATHGRTGAITSVTGCWTNW